MPPVHNLYPNETISEYSALMAALQLHKYKTFVRMHAPESGSVIVQILTVCASGSALSKEELACGMRTICPSQV